MEEIMIGREMNPKEMIPEEENQEGAKIFGKLAGASLLYALVYTGCLFENVMGLASVLWVASSVWYVRFVFRMFGEKERRDNGIVLGMIVLLGISTVLTGNEWIGWMNDLIIFVLLVGILLHNFAQDTGWNFGKYLAEIVAAVCGAVCFIGKPFADGGAFYRSKKTRESHAGWYVLIGICAAVPCLMVLVLLLMSADMVFADLLVRFAGVFRFPVKLLRILLMLVFGFLSSYCGVRYVQNARTLGTPDLILLPGTKNTIDDLLWLRQSGLEPALLKLAARGTPVFGVCGGYQMLGRSVSDPDGVEDAGLTQIRGLGLLDMDTVFHGEKVQRQTAGTFSGVQGLLSGLNGLGYEGYEIHMGQSASAMPPLAGSGSVYGSYIHGVFDAPGVADAILRALCARRGIDASALGSFDAQAYKERQYDLLADAVRQGLDMDYVYRVLHRKA